MRKNRTRIGPEKKTLQRLDCQLCIDKRGDVCRFASGFQQAKASADFHKPYVRGWHSINLRDAMIRWRKACYFQQALRQWRTSATDGRPPPLDVRHWRTSASGGRPPLADVSAAAMMGWRKACYFQQALRHWRTSAIGELPPLP